MPLSRSARVSNVSHVAAGLHGLLEAAHEAWSAHRAAAARRREDAKSIAELAALDDLMLADLGISRSAIPALVAGTDGLRVP